MLADLAVLSADPGDPTEVDPARLREVEVRETWLGGERVLVRVSGRLVELSSLGAADVEAVRAIYEGAFPDELLAPSRTSSSTDARLPRRGGRCGA